MTEEEAYPLKEMINEWAGITGLYFGCSFLSIIGMIKGTIVTYRNKRKLKAKLRQKISEKIRRRNQEQAGMQVDDMPTTK